MHIFNISVDMPDAQPDCIAEDLTINDQESVVELVLEQVLGVENAIAEHDEQDESNDQNFQMCKDFKLYSQSVQNFVFNAEIQILTAKPLYDEPFLAEYIGEIQPRPPRA